MTTTRKAIRTAPPNDAGAAAPRKKPAPVARAGKAPAAALPPTAPAPAKPGKHEAEGKSRQKLIRDSFTIPKSEVATLDALKLRAATLARPVKKSEILRAGIAALNLMSDKALLTALARVPSLKTGRPPAAAPTPGTLENI